MPRSEVRPVGVAKIPFGLNLGETIAVLLAAALLVFVVVQYFSSLKPEQDRLRAVEAELDTQQKSIMANAKAPGAAEVNVEDQAKIALESLETFKGSYLKSFSSGRIALIKEINALAKKNSVTLTSGIDMGADMGESNPDGEQKEENRTTTTKRKKADDLLNAFPSVGFRFTVFGQYPNIRTFINELEREKQFLVINSLNLTNQEAKTSSRRSRGGEGASGIMLTIEMSAYFQPM